MGLIKEGKLAFFKDHSQRHFKRLEKRIYAEEKVYLRILRTVNNYGLVRQQKKP